MINRRHIRIKVMQSAYALLLSGNDKLDPQERYLKDSIDLLHQLYIVQLQLLVAISKRAELFFKASKKNFVSSKSPLVTSSNFTNNKVLLQIKGAIELAEIENDYSNIWEDHNEIIVILWNKIKSGKHYDEYMHLESPSYDDDKKFLINIYKKIIAPSDYLYELYESKEISWVDDIPFTNTWILGNLNAFKASNKFVIDSLYKDKEDKQFSIDLFRKTVLNFNKYEKDIDAKTPNWDSERITRIDKLLMIMAISEFFHFPSIPTKVSINEYIEIAKDYATPKSSYFINGVLDKLLADYKKDDLIKKTGRGLM